MAKDFKMLTKVAKFCQIWSHCKTLFPSSSSYHSYGFFLFTVHILEGLIHMKKIIIMQSSSSWMLLLFSSYYSYSESRWR